MEQGRRPPQKRASAGSAHGLATGPASECEADRIRWREQLERSTGWPDWLSAPVAASGGGAEALGQVCGRFPARITPYYASLIRPEDPRDPLGAMVLPDPRELDCDEALEDDPLAEDAHMPVQNLVHRYPDRALLLATDVCAVHCRFCTRKRRVGRMSGPLSDNALDAVCAYLAARPRVRDVIVSGGDPLTLEDRDLDRLLGRLRSIASVSVLRLGTRMCAVLPARVTADLAAVLARYNPLYVLTHFNHPRELTDEAHRALRILADHGLAMANQTVLLRSVNDQVEILEELFRTLLAARVRPYYLHQCDLTSGNGHFRTPLSAGLDLVAALRSRLGGLATPTFAVDLPGGRGKVALEPDRLFVDHSGRVVIRDGEGVPVEYPDVKFGLSDPG